MRLICLFISMLLWTKTFAVETRGILEPLEGKAIVVGESYPYRLTLLPFDKRLFDSKKLEGTSFLNLFYVAKVNQIKESPNNYDAVEVFFDLVLIRKAELREIYIWNLEDRNIPVEVRPISINDVQLNTKNFLLLKTPNVEFEENNYRIWGIGILIFVLIMVALIFWLGKRKKGLKENEIDVAQLLYLAKSHKDLEEIYNKRNKILLKVKSPLVQRNFRDVVIGYEVVQYSPNWKSTNIEDYIKKMNELGEELKRGV